MELRLNDDDLLPRHKMVNCSATRFEHFNRKAQQAIRLVGRAVYYRRDSHNAIYPPKKQKGK